MSPSLVILKSISISKSFCVNPSIGLADKSLFKNESYILKIYFFRKISGNDVSFSLETHSLDKTYGTEA